jgi:hypothetical protein
VTDRGSLIAVVTDIFSKMNSLQSGRTEWNDFRGSPRTEGNAARTDRIKTQIDETYAKSVLTVRTSGLSCISCCCRGTEEIERTEILHEISSSHQSGHVNHI